MIEQYMKSSKNSVQKINIDPRIEIFRSIMSTDEVAFKKIYPLLSDVNLLSDQGITIIQTIIAQRSYYKQQTKKVNAIAMDKKRAALLSMLTFVLDTANSQKININMQTIHKKTALHFAADLEDLEAVNLLLGVSDVNVLDKNNAPGIYQIAEWKQQQTIKEIMKKNILFTPRTLYSLMKIFIEKKDFGLISLSIAKLKTTDLVPEDYADIMLRLIKLGSDLNPYIMKLLEKVPERDRRYTFLYNDLLLSANIPMLYALLDKEIPLQPNQLEYALDLALQRKDVKLFDLLLMKSDKTNLASSTVINLVGNYANNAELNEYSIKLLNKITENDDSYQLLYDYANNYQNTELLSALIYKQIPLSGEQYFTTLTISIFKNDIKLFNDLMPHYEQHPLQIDRLLGLISMSITSSEVKVYAPILIDKLPEAKPEAAALYFNCIDVDNADVIEMLFGKKIPAPFNEHGLTVMNIAIMLSKTHCMRSLPLLIQDFYAVNDFGETALHRAIRMGNTEYLTYLVQQNEMLKNSENVQILNHLHSYQEITADKKTLLHYAVLFKNYSSLKFILDLKIVDLEAKDVHGMTALDYAISDHSRDMIDLLIAENAKLNDPYLQQYDLIMKAPEPVPEIKMGKTEESKITNTPAPLRKKTQPSALKVPPKNFLSKVTRDHWQNMLYNIMKLDKDNIHHISWQDWHISSNVQENIHPKLPIITTIITTELGNRLYEDEKGQIRFKRHDGIYLVGSEALNALYLNKVHISTNDVDLMIIGLTVDEVLKLLADNGIEYKYQIGNNKESVSILFKDELRKIDITCIDSDDLDANLHSRLFTISGIAIDLTKQEIAAQPLWLKHAISKSPIISCIDNPSTVFSDFFSKIRAVALYAKLQPLHPVVEEKTEIALKEDQLTSFKQFAKGRKDNPHFKLVRLLSEKIFEPYGFHNGYKLLKTCELLKQIQIPEHQIPELFSREFRFPKKLTDREEKFKKLLENLLSSVKQATNITTWQDSNQPELSILVEMLENSEAKSLIRNHGTRFMTSLVAAGLDLAKALNLSEDNELKKKGVPGY